MQPFLLRRPHPFRRVRVRYSGGHLDSGGASTDHRDLPRAFHLQSVHAAFVTRWRVLAPISNKRRTRTAFGDRPCLQSNHWSFHFKAPRTKCESTPEPRWPHLLRQSLVLRRSLCRRLSVQFRRERTGRPSRDHQSVISDLQCCSVEELISFTMRVLLVFLHLRETHLFTSRSGYLFLFRVDVSDSALLEMFPQPDFQRDERFQRRT